MGRIIPLAAELNVTQEELFGSMATLTGVTGNTAEVSTQLKGILSGMVKPTEELKDILAAYGYESGKAALESEGLQGTLNLLKDATNGNSEEFAALFGRVEATNAALALTGSQSENFTKKTKAMGDAVGATEEAFARQNNTLKATGERLKNQFNVIAISVGERMLPRMREFADFIDRNMPAIENVIVGTFEAINKITKIFFGEFKKRTQFYVDNWETIKYITLDTAIKVLESIKFIIDALDDWTRNNKDSLNDIWEDTQKFAIFMIDLFEKYWKWGLKLWEDNGETLFRIITKSFKLIKDLIVADIEFIKKIWEDFGDEISAVVKLIFDGLAIIITATLKNIENYIDLFHAIVKGNWQDAWDEIKSIMFLDEIVMMFKYLWQDIKPILIDFKKNLTTWFFDLYDSFFIAGVNIINGVINGMKSKIADSVDAVKGVGTKLIEGFKNKLDIHSPSLLFRMFGINIFEGLKNGLKESEPKAKKSGEDLGDSAADGMKNSTKGFLAAGSEGIQGFINTLIGYRDETKKTGEEIGEEAGEAMADGTVKGLKEGAEKNKDATKNVFKDMSLGIKNFFKEDWGDISDITTAVAGQVGGKWGDAMNSVAQAGNIAAKAMSGDFVGAAIDIINTGPSIVQGIGKAFGLIDEGHKFTAENTRKTWEKTLKSIAEETEKFATDFGKTLGDTIENIIKKYEENTRGRLGTWLFGKKNELDSQVEYVLKSVEGMSSSISGYLTHVSEENHSVFDTIYRSIINTSDIMQTYLGDMADEIKEDYHDVWEDVVALVEESSEAIEELIKELTDMAIEESNKLGEAIIEALTERYDEEERLFNESLDKQISDLEKANDKKKGIYQEDYYNRISLINEEAAAKIKAVQDEIDAIDQAAEDEEKRKKAIADNLKRYELQIAITEAESLEEREKAQDKYNQFILKLEEEKIKEERKIKKEALELEIESIHEQANAKIEAEEEAYDKKVELLDSELEATKTNLEDQRQANADHYAELREAQNLQAEAIRIATAENQDELLNLLGTYNEGWQDAGQSFGEQLLNGLNSQKQGIQAAVDDILSKVEKAGKAEKELQELLLVTEGLDVGMEAAKEKAELDAQEEAIRKKYEQQISQIERSSGSSISGGNQYISQGDTERIRKLREEMERKIDELTSQNQGLVQHINITAPKGSTVAETARAYKSAGQQLAARR